MSLIRELWLAIAVVMTLAFGGTFAISTAAARNYFAQQLMVKNIDNATALALSMSHIDKDPVTLELLIAAQFDAGHYRLIRLADPQGRVFVERRSDAPVAGVPAFFVDAVSLDAAPGVAQVQDGWKQYGTLTVQSHDQYAYVELWKGTLNLLGSFLIGALLSALIGSWLLQRILRPLQAVVAQAEAIGDRRFVTNAEPRTLEFRRLVRAMNTLSDKVRRMLEDQAQRVEQLRREAQLDPVTGLLNRATFLGALEGALARDDDSSAGVLVILRLPDLVDLNRRLGRQAVDGVLRRVGRQLTQAASGHPRPWAVARLNGGDFAVLAPGESGAAGIARRLAAQAQLALEHPETGTVAPLPAGCAHYHRGESRAAVLARVDGALAEAEQGRDVVVEAPDTAPGAALPADQESWRRTLQETLEVHGVQLGHYPVVGADGALLHHEAPVQLRIGDDWQPASRFIAWAARLGLLPLLDSHVIDAALQRIVAEDTAISVNLSPESICDPRFRRELARGLQRAPEAAAKLWLDIPEHGALRHLGEFRALCQALHPLGCQIGLKHAGHEFVRIAELHDLGLDYLKVDASIVHGIDQSSSHQAFLRGLCTVAHAIGLTVIGTGVASEEEQRVLLQLGVDGLTGPMVRAPA